MYRLIAIYGLFLLSEAGSAQGIIQGKVIDSDSEVPIVNATISYFIQGQKYGIVSNEKGQFAIDKNNVDSMQVSSIGYESIKIFPPYQSNQTINLPRVIYSMETVVIQSLTTEEIIKRAISNLHQRNPSKDFEELVFYRERIKDKKQYFSVSEAMFKTQYFPKEKSFQLALEQGRAKEDVAYTRLFEDFHPGGGPQLMAKQAFIIEVPDCLQQSQMKNFVYKIDSITYLDDQRLYIISFDQKDGIKEALEKGEVYINTEDFSIVKYIGSNSPKGKDYIKSLTGSDKIMAKILGIDFELLGWNRKLLFSTKDNISYLSFASYTQELLYKQPKKNIDLDLTMSFEWMISNFAQSITKKIKADEEWKKGDLMINLPTAFDSSFWYGKPIISPTDSLTDLVRAISIRNGEDQNTRLVEGWEYFNRKFFVAFQKEARIELTPTMKCVWEDHETGPFLYKESSGNFNLECYLQIIKASDNNKLPDKGFQQGGLMIRADATNTENYVFLTLGTGGNPNPKMFFKKTEVSKSKTLVNKSNSLSAFLRIEKVNDEVKAFIKWKEDEPWSILGNYKAPWVKEKVQIGMAAFTDFTGNGPKMHPDASFIFSDIKFKK